MLWQPQPGQETRRVLNNVPQASRDQVLSESLEVLGNCLPPWEQGRRTGLVVGYVQSGKTMSFTAVSALAHDNGFRLVIVITGTSMPLFEQSNSRLRGDLRLGVRRGRWKHFRADQLQGDDVVRSIEAAFERWRDEDVPEDERQTVVVTALKHSGRLGDLIALLRQLSLADVPAIVIDDEADQASLNNQVRNGDQSATYRRLVELRSVIPSHSLIQYTATPQAPLLINLIDILSPDFGVVLTPGADYIGGSVFFGGGQNLVRVIPAGDIPTQNNVLTTPPESLQKAMRIFFLGVAAESLANSDIDVRSMMVHPSKKTAQHEEFVVWVQAIRDRWRRTLENPEDDSDRQALVEEFRQAYDDLSRTVPELPEFGRVLRQLRRILRETGVHQVNARQVSPTPSVPWEREDSHILVGGQALERGYTVRGLTVTYMPRGRGVGNADTIQQRARWFGYKADYLGFCRVYLAQDTLDSLIHYSEHEEDVRARLASFQRQGRSLRDWKRAFILSRDLRPTRQSVLGFDYIRGNFHEEWVYPRWPHMLPDIVSENRRLVAEFHPTVTFSPNEGHPDRLDHHKHHVAPNLSLQLLHESLLSRYKLAEGRDSERFTGLLLQVQTFLEEEPDALATVVLMSPHARRERGTGGAGQIQQLFQGAYPTRGTRIYPGDREIHQSDQLTVQIHVVSIYQGKVAQGKRLMEDVPILAVWVPRQYERHWLVQSQ